MGRISRPSVLKRQKEQKRLEKAARKREERQARKVQKEDLPEGAPLETQEQSTEELA